MIWQKDKGEPYTEGLSNSDQPVKAKISEGKRDACLLRVRERDLGREFKDNLAQPRMVSISSSIKVVADLTQVVHRSRLLRRFKEGKF